MKKYKAQWTKMLKGKWDVNGYVMCGDRRSE